MGEEKERAGMLGAPADRIVVSTAALDALLKATAMACARSLRLVADARPDDIPAILRSELSAFEKAARVATDDPALRDYPGKIVAEIRRRVEKHIDRGVDVATRRKEAHNPSCVSRDLLPRDSERVGIDVRDESRERRADGIESPGN